MKNNRLPPLEDFLSGKVKSLGLGVLNWASTYLGHPDGAELGESLEFTTEQALFILRFYAIDERGKFLFNHAILERPK